uniref:Uncharacterized protein n=1 Tax=Tetraselmis sp. GSL018 TaxID=582737 RepID=A0A061SI60_9CHLO
MSAVFAPPVFVCGILGGHKDRSRTGLTNNCLRVAAMPSRKETNRLKSANFRSKIGSSSDARAASAQLVRLVRQTPEDSAYNATILSLVDELTALKVPLPEESLRGAWEVAWSDGTMAWRALVARAVQSIAGNCRAGQCFNLETGEALNFAELFDKRCTITGSPFSYPSL